MALVHPLTRSHGATRATPPRAVPTRARLGQLATAALLAVLVAVGLWYAVLSAQGGRIFTVQTPSMARTAPVGTLVVTRPVATGDVHVGDVISFRPPNINRVYTHRVVDVAPGGFKTQGDLNSSPDGWIVPGNRIVGRAVHLWFGVGWLLRMVPWLVAGGVLTALARYLCRPRNRVAATICGSSLAVSLALTVVRPLVRAETTGFLPVGHDGVKISAIATGLLPIRAKAADGGHVDLVPGQIGWVTTHQADSHGRFQIIPSLHLPWWGWMLVGLACALPMIASLWAAHRLGEQEPDDTDDAPGRGAAALGAVAHRLHLPALKRPRLRRSGAALRTAAYLAATLSLGLAVDPTSAALTAKVTNSTNTAASRTYFTCADVMQLYSGTTNNGQLNIGYPVGDGTGMSGTTTLGTKSSATLKLTNVTQTTNVGCQSDYEVRGQKAGTLDGSTSKLNVSGPSFSSVDGDPQFSNAITIQVWFRTTTTRGGVLGCMADTLSHCTDRTLYMANSGKVVWGVGSSTISSPTALNDGKWHLAVGQLDSSAGITLWIDGAQVAANASVTGGDGNVVYGQWGYSAAALPSGWSTYPTSLFFAGDMQFVAVYGRINGRRIGTSDVQLMYSAAQP